MSKMLIHIIGRNKEAMTNLLKTHHIEIIRQTAQMLSDSQGYCVDAIVESAQIEQLRELDYQVEVKENLEEVAKARQALVDRGDRFSYPSHN